MFGFKSKPKEPFQPPKEIAPGVEFPIEIPEREKYEVKVPVTDPDHPMLWSRNKKLGVLLALSYVIAVATWGSAIGAPATEVLQKIYHLGLPVATLNVSLYVVGFAVGPVVWGPAGGLYGRRNPLFVSNFGQMLFFFAAGASKDFQTLVLSRFFQGIFAAGAITLGPAMAGDFFGAKYRGTALTFVAFCVCAGPMLAPIVGGYITQSFLGYRWTQYITGIMSALSCFIVLLFIPETYGKQIAQTRAAKLRKETGNWAICAEGELQTLDMKAIVNDVLLGPIKMLISEAILLLVSIYHGFIYGILYLCLEAVPLIFAGFGFPGANVFLPYIAILIGAMVVCLLNIVVFEPWYFKQLEKKGVPVLPENRLPLMILSGGVFVMGIFWMCWAGAYPQHVHWIVPMIGGSFVGFGLIGIFLGAFNYILDTYLSVSAMAFAANTFLRSAFGAAFPLFVRPMFKNLGYQWAGTLIGCLGALLFPVPIMFYFFGARLRSISHYAVNLDDSSKEEEKEAEDDAAFSDMSRETTPVHEP